MGRKAIRGGTDNEGDNPWYFLNPYGNTWENYRSAFKGLVVLVLFYGGIIALFIWLVWFQLPEYQRQKEEKQIEKAWQEKAEIRKAVESEIEKLRMEGKLYNYGK